MWSKFYQKFYFNAFNLCIRTPLSWPASIAQSLRRGIFFLPKCQEFRRQICQRETRTRDAPPIQAAVALLYRDIPSGSITVGIAGDGSGQCLDMIADFLLDGAKIE